MKQDKKFTLLATRGSLSYTELMEQLDVLTGILNYHLKVLGDLIEKNESGQYLLTEKGKLASRLLVEFPVNSLNKRKKQKKFWTVAALIQVIGAITGMILYYYNRIDSGIFAIFITGSVGSVFLAYLGYKVQGDRPPQGSKQERERMRIVYVLGGGLVGAAIAFFGPPMLSIMSFHSGGPNILRLIENHCLLEFIVIFLFR
jgi:hypothetical protein